MLKALVIGSMVALFSISASSQEVYGRASDLDRALAMREYGQKHASPSASVTGAFAVRYVRDVFDQVTSAPFCDRKVSDDELVRVTKQWFKLNRRWLNYVTAYELTHEAMVVNYPCY